MPKNTPALFEIGAGLAVISLAAFLVLTGVLSESGCVLLAAAMLTALVFLSWKRFNGGRHPCFLFLGMLLVFQGGRLLGYSFGLLRHPMEIVVSTAEPIRISAPAAEITLLIVVLSAVLIYAPCRLGYRPVLFRAGSEMQWLPALYVLVLLTFPFAFYKNWLYFSFIRAHGGYLSVYTDNAAILRSAGTLVRGVALINSTALLVAYVFERRPKRIAFLLVLYFAVSALDLLIGFRGKFFSEVLGLWFLHKLKTGKRFNLLPLVAAVVAVSLAAVAVGAFREDRSLRMLSPLGFLVQEGVSLNVTEAAVAFQHTFGRFGFRYLWGGFIFGIVQTPGWLHHQLWTNDLTLYLNPIAEEMGYGTASTYLAELYLAAGITGVAIGSLLVGFVLNWLHHASRRAWGAVLLAVVLPPVIYLPRLEFLAPLAVLVKAAVSLAVIAAFAMAFEPLRKLWAAALRPALPAAGR